MGPGPSDVHPRVLRAMSTPLVGHLDPAFIVIMKEVQALLRYTFRTENRWTIPVSGTGSAAMEAAFANMVEPGDVVLVPTNGYFGARMDSMARRAGGQVVHVNAPWGEPLDPDDVRAAFEEHRPRVFGFVHAETSTGALQPNVPELTAIAHEHGAFVIADTVTSLGGVELRVDETALAILQQDGGEATVLPAGPNDFDQEWLALILGVKVVPGLDEAIDHIHQHSTDHSESILTNNWAHANRFIDEINSSAVFVNASTRFNDGGEFGLGAEVAISTQKLHARGPMGLEELTTYKWIGLGDGHVRK